MIGRPAILEDAAAWLDACCRRAYQVGSCALAIDELAGIVNASSPPPWLDTVQTRGRESGITTVIVSQRPRRIPLTILSEAEHVFAFDLNVPDDRRFLAELFGDFWAPASRHGFLYWRPDMAAPVECSPIAT